MKMMRFGLFASFLLVLAALEFSVSVTKKPIRYLALGDSYTIGESVASKDAWPNQLANGLAANGIPVETTQIVARTGWKTRNLQEALLAAPPTGTFDLVSLLIGVNDYFQGRSIEEYELRFTELLKSAIGYAGGRKGHVVVVSIPDYSYTPLYEPHRDIVSKNIDAFNAVNRRVALAAGVHYVDVTAISREWPEAQDWVALDGLHPSAQQYMAWAKAIFPVAHQALSN